MVKRITSNHIIYAIIFFTHYGMKVRATYALDCNFDQGLCKWKQATGDKFNWTWTSNGTSTANTGPNADHTSGEGGYVFIDTSSNGVNKQDNAWLRSRLHTPGTPGTYCFSFWYYMYGQHVGRLRVFKTHNWTKLFEESGNNGKSWKFGQTEFAADTKFRIIIVGIVINSTNHDLGDIAIDDVMMFPGRCKGCGDPSPAFGIANSENFTIGSKVTLKCEEGYTFKGTPSVTCLANRTWSDEPNCNIKDCSKPIIDNGKIANMSEGFTNKASVAMTCDNGYLLQGNTTVTCQADGSWSNLPSCLIKNCSDPSPSSGKASSSNFQYGSVVEIKCVRGYKIRGYSSIACQADGSWSSKPVCEQIDCEPRKIKNGQFTAVSGTVYEKKATQSCNIGYTFAGDRTVVCTESGWNGTMATCIIVDCSMPFITNGNTSESVGDTTYNQTVRLECVNGYTLTGNSIITCQADGYWTTLPVCDIQESETKALIAVYVSVPIVVVALVIGLIILMMRKRLITCMPRQYYNKKNAKTSQPLPGSSFNNRAYIGHNIETQSDKENRLPEDTDYAVITEEQDRKQQSESYVYYNTVDSTITQRENDDHAYSHTDNVTAPFFDMSYSHVSKNKDESNVKSNYNTTILPCRTNEGFQSDVQDQNNKYDILDSNVTVQRFGAKLEEDLDPEYDHAKAGGTDPEDLDDYSHLNGAVMKPIKNDAKEVSGTEYEYAKEISEAEPNRTYPAQVRKGGYKPQNYDFEVDNRDSVEDDRHYFVLEKEDNENAEQSGSFESNVHDYFVLEKMET